MFLEIENQAIINIFSTQMDSSGMITGNEFIDLKVSLRRLLNQATIDDIYFSNYEEVHVNKIIRQTRNFNIGTGWFK